MESLSSRAIILLGVDLDDNTRETRETQRDERERSFDLPFSWFSGCFTRDGCAVCGLWSVDMDTALTFKPRSV